RVDRLWFKAEWFITDQFKIIVETTKNRLDRVIEGWIKEQFLMYKTSPLRYNTKYLAERLNEAIKYKVDETDLREYFKKKNMHTETPRRVNIPCGWNVDSDPNFPQLIYHHIVARPYVFHYEDWLNEDEAEEFTNAPVQWKLEEVGSDAAGDGISCLFDRDLWD
nr:hypothetical protein [Flavobacteriales bacterium]